MRIAMMAITTVSSMRVKPDWDRLEVERENRRDGAMAGVMGNLLWKGRPGGRREARSVRPGAGPLSTSANPADERAGMHDARRATLLEDRLYPPYSPFSIEIASPTNSVGTPCSAAALLNAGTSFVR